MDKWARFEASYTEPYNQQEIDAMIGQPLEQPHESLLHWAGSAAWGMVEEFSSRSAGLNIRVTRDIASGLAWGLGHLHLNSAAQSVQNFAARQDRLIWSLSGTGNESYYVDNAYLHTSVDIALTAAGEFIGGPVLRLAGSRILAPASQWAMRGMQFGGDLVLSGIEKTPGLLGDGLSIAWQTGRGVVKVSAQATRQVVGTLGHSRQMMVNAGRSVFGRMAFFGRGVGSNTPVDVVFYSKSAAEMASELRSELGRNSVSFRTVNKTGHIDLEGESHYDKLTKTDIDTPHVQVRDLHIGPNGQISAPLKSEIVRPATKADIRLARHLAAQQGLLAQIEKIIDDEILHTQTMRP